MKKITKQQFTTQLAYKLKLSQKQGKQVYDAFINLILENLENNIEVNLIKFGLFKVRTHSQRLCLNPHTKEKILKPKTRHIHFKPSKNTKIMMRA